MSSGGKYFLTMHITDIEEALRKGVAVMVNDEPYWMGFTLRVREGLYSYCHEHQEKKPCSYCTAEAEYAL